MPEIKFSHNYPKLRGQQTAFLLHVETTQTAKLDPLMVELDTVYGDNEHYPLPNGTVIVLTFYGNKRIPFTTIRPYGYKKVIWYESMVGKLFDIVVGEVKPEVEQQQIPLAQANG